MAYESGNLETGIADVEKEITCWKCKEVFEECKVLLCGHSFCEKCLDDLSSKVEGGAMVHGQCPECSTEVSLPSSGADGLSGASYVVHKDMITTHMRNTSRKCEIHNEPLALFCNECECVVCQDCSLKEHKDHNCEYNSIAAPREKECLLEAIKPLKEVKYDYKVALAKVKGVQENLSAQGETVTKYVTSYFNDLHRMLDECKQNLLEKNQQSLMKKLANLKAQEKDLSNVYTDLQNATESAEMHVSSCSNDEIMAVYPDLKKQISKTKKDYNFGFGSRDYKRHQSCDLQPVEGTFSDVKVMSPAQFMAVSETFAQFSEIPIISKDVLIQDLNHDATVNTMYSFLLLSKNSI